MTQKARAIMLLVSGRKKKPLIAYSFYELQYELQSKMKSATIQSESHMDDEVIRLGLLEDDPRLQLDAFNALYAMARRPLAGMLLNRFGGLSSHDHGEIINETFINLHTKWKSEGLDLDKPLLPLLFKMAAARAIDLLRANNAQKRNHVEFGADVAAILEAQGFGSEWRFQISMGKAREIEDKFLKLYPTLPKLQMLVGQAIANGLPDPLNDTELCDQIEAVSGKRYSLLSVKEARLELRKQFRQFMAEK